MNFAMVMIIFFLPGVCTAVFNKTTFTSYDSCIKISASTAEYMKQNYPASAGEIYCMTTEEASNYKLFLDNGGTPTLSKPKPAFTEA